MLSFLALASAATWPAIDVTPGPAHPDDAAVVIGIENYLLVDDVPGARLNAEDWYRWLVKSRGVPTAQVHLLRDTEASREAIASHLEKAAAQVGPKGTLWMVFIGHGAPTPDGRDGVLVGMDAMSDPNSLYARSLPRSEVLDTLNGAQAAARVLVLDSCFSGQSAAGSLMKGLQPVVPTYATAVPESTAVLTAATATQFAGPLPGAGRPAFSYLVLGALQGWGDLDGDGTITADEAVRYAGDVIGATVKGREQTPERSGGDVVLATATGTGPDIAELVLQSGPPPAPAAALKPDEAVRQQTVREAQQQADAREQDRLAALEAQIRQQLADSVKALQAQAAAAWTPIAAAPSRDTVLAFVTRYGAAKVTVGDVDQQVSVPEVRDARTWLDGDASTEAPTPWTVIDTQFAPLFLWQPMGGWRQGLDGQPNDVWFPYQWLHALQGVSDVDPGTSTAAVADAEAYASAWARTADADRRRDLAYALRGLVAETREIYVTSHTQGPVPSWLSDRRAMAAEHHSYELITGAIGELLERAESADACDKWVPKLEAMLPVELGDFDEVFDEAAKLAPKVHKCAAKP